MSQPPPMDPGSGDEDSSNLSDDQPPMFDPPLTISEGVHARLVVQWLRDSWECNDDDAVDQYIHRRCSITGLAPEVLENRQQVRSVQAVLCGRLIDASLRIDSILVRGDQFAVFATLDAIHRDSEIGVVIEIAMNGRIKQQKIYRAQYIIDYAGMYSKLGAFNPQTLRQLLG